MNSRFVWRVSGVASVLLMMWSAVLGGDWPTWRCDAGRSGASTAELPASLTLQWTRALPPQAVAWPDEPLMTYDAVYAPVAQGDLLFLGSTVCDAVIAYDMRTGAERWRTYTNGPVRFAPALWHDRVYVVSDDGFLYCLDAANGAIKWTFRGAPGARLLFGNSRLISAWPARGGPVISENVVYFAAGIWPMMGVFLYGVDADTGQQRWIQDGCGSMYIMQPHDSPAFAGPAPQGYLAVSGAQLLAPCGRSTPACFERATGAFRYFRLAENKETGNAQVCASDRYYLNDGVIYDSATGKSHAKIGAEAIIDGDTFYSQEKGVITASIATIPDLPLDLGNTFSPRLPLRWQFAGGWTLLCKAGSRLYIGKPGMVGALHLPAAAGSPTLTWTTKISGVPGVAIAADDRLIVVTREGTLYAFGGQRPPSVTRYPLPVAPSATGSDAVTRAVEDVLARTGMRDGNAMVWGIGDGAWLQRLCERSRFHLVGCDPDAANVERVRRQCDARGLYGTRISLLVGDAAGMMLPPYFANLVVVPAVTDGRLGDADFLTRLFAVLRPYGGTAALACTPAQHARLSDWLAAHPLAQARLSRAGDWTLLTRDGSLPGAGQWTQQYADAGNTLVSPDELVKAPLGLLWFGGASDAMILPRHGHGPAPQVVGGRIIIEGPDELRALDVYSGRVLWEAALPKLGTDYNNTLHQPGANAIGSNYACAPDGIYVLYGDHCLRLNPDTGAVMATFTIPADGKKMEKWGSLALWQDLLVATVAPFTFEEKRIGTMTWDGTASRRLVILNRFTGKVLWTRDAVAAYRHNSIAAGNGTVYCIDALPADKQAQLHARGVATKADAQLLALDARTGAVRWSTRERVFGTWLGYSAETDTLIQSGRPSRDMLPDEPKPIIAYQGGTGNIRWSADAIGDGPYMLAGDTLITQGAALDVRTGAEHMRTDPLTGVAERWTFSRNYGCNTAIGSKYLLTFRSAAAGFYDLATDGGTGNLGGFKSGCTSNLIAADGVLIAPDYTHTCICRYQNQSSLAFIYQPEVEMWTWNKLPKVDAPLLRVGLNFGAPGDRRSETGTLWLDYPSVGGPSPDVPVTIEPATASYYRHHASRFTGPLPWVAASGVEGAERITIHVQPTAAPPRRYTVRLLFAEPEDRAAGARVFTVALQGQQLGEAIDLVRDAGGVRQSLQREAQHVVIAENLVVTLTRSADSIAPPLLCGLELVAE